MESDVSNICSINDATAAYQDFNKTNTHYGAITVKASFYTKILNTIFLKSIISSFENIFWINVNLYVSVQGIVL